ncbi:MAG: histidine kinase, partial [Paludibacter sp.]|nr:histidine kinase [Paludibacter sp.]
MKKKIFWEFGFLFCLLCGTVEAEELLTSEYSYRRYTTQDGLPSMMSISFYQVDNVALWIGSNNGFSRFDGFTFTNFLENKSKNIFHFYSKSDGELWAFTFDSVYVVKKNEIVRSFMPVADTMLFNMSNSRYLPKGYIIYEDRKKEKYLFREENGAFKLMLHSPELNDIGEAYPYLDEQNGKLYLPAYKKQQVNIYDMKTEKISVIKNTTAEFFLKHSTLGLLALDKDGIYSVNDDKMTKLVDKAMERNQQAHEMKDGSIIIIDRKTIYRYHKGKIETCVEDASTYFINFFVDKEENFWLATFTKGLYNYFHFDFRNYQLKDELIKSVVQDNNGDYLIGTFVGNLYKYSDGKTEKMVYPTLGANRNFWNGVSTANSTIYLPRGPGILKYKDKKFSWILYDDYKVVKKTIPLPDENLLVVDYLGLFLFDKNDKLLKSWKNKDLQIGQVLDATFDSQGEIIVCGGGKYPNNLVSLNMNDSSYKTFSPYSHAIQHIEKDFSGNIWLGSSANLLLLRSDTIVTVTNFQNAEIRAIKAINNKYLLISTAKGIYLFDTQSYLSEGAIQTLHYDHLSGMMGVEPETCSAYLDRNGLMWIVSSESLVSFNPELLIRQRTAPTMNIHSCETSADNVHWESLASDGKISLDYRHNNLRFSVIGINFSAAQNVRYYYRLLGFQNEFSEPTRQREVTFNNLPYGDYTFEIYADAGTDDSKSEIQRFSFSIKPAFWQTAWFWIAFVALLVMASVTVALYFANKKNRILVEKLETEKQLNELRIKSIRLKAIPHFNANVLAAIEYYIMNMSKTEALRLLGIYSRFTFQTLREVDRASRSLNEELEYVKMYLELEKLRFVNKFDYQIEVEPTVDTGNVQLPNMILHTYCENAVKHGLSSKNGDGALNIKIIQSGDLVCVSVEDNGVGREAASRNKNIP